MKGKNKPTRRQKKKQMNIIEDKKPSLKAKMAQEVGDGHAWSWCGWVVLSTPDSVYYHSRAYTRG